MKNLTVLAVVLFLAAGCSNDEVIPQAPPVAKSELTISGVSGIKLETTFVTAEVAMNAKVEEAGKATIKIYDISNRVISKEEVEVKLGDNVLKMHTAILPTSAYRISLTDKNGKVLGVADFNKI